MQRLITLLDNCLQRLAGILMLVLGLAGAAAAWHYPALRWPAAPLIVILICLGIIHTFTRRA